MGESGHHPQLLAHMYRFGGFTGGKGVCFAFTWRRVFCNSALHGWLGKTKSSLEHICMLPGGTGCIPYDNMEERHEFGFLVSGV